MPGSNESHLAHEPPPLFVDSPDRSVRLELHAARASVAVIKRLAANNAVRRGEDCRYEIFIESPLSKNYPFAMPESIADMRAFVQA